MSEPGVREEDLLDPRVPLWAATGTLPQAEAQQRLNAARAEFRRELVKHHNGCVLGGQLPDAAEIWDIPRLSALRLMLDWEQKPDREQTRYMSLGEFRDRPVLPTPAGVAGQQDPQVRAQIPESAPAPSTLGQVTSEKMRAGPTASPPVATRRGRIVSYSISGVVVQLEGEAKPRKLRVSTEIFPTPAPWTKISGGQLHPGRRIVAELRGENVIRVMPAP